jgi:hypothetical protein
MLRIVKREADALESRPFEHLSSEDKDHLQSLREFLEEVSGGGMSGELPLWQLEQC